MKGRDPAPSRAPRRRCAIGLAVLVGGLGLVVLAGADRTAARPRHGAAFEGTALSPATARSFRVATFNIHGGRDRAGRPALDGAIETLRGLDVVGLQEVRGPSLWGGAGQAERLGRALRLAWCFAPSERRWWRDHAGNGALSRLPVADWSTMPLVNTRGKAYRNVLKARLRVAERTVAVLITHLDPRDDRQAQLDVIVPLFLGLPEPAMLLGDLNAGDTHPSIRALRATPGVIDPLARVAANPPAGRIDWIFVRGLRVLRAGVLDRGASDHACVWAELMLPDA